MRILLKAAVAAALSITVVSTASAQFADRRSFLHPLGFWSNDYYVAQREIYPRFFHAPRDPHFEAHSDGGWVLHERNW